MYRALCALLLLVLCPLYAAAQMPAISPDAFTWTFFVHTKDNEPQTMFIEGISSAGSVTGWLVGQGPTDISEPFVLENGHERSITCPTLQPFTPNAINAAGFVVAGCRLAEPNPTRQVVGTIIPPPGIAWPMPTFQFANYVELTDMNDYGHVIGRASTFSATERTPFWAGGIGPGNSDGGPVIELPVHIDGEAIPFGQLLGMNNAGGMVGYYSDSAGNNHGLVYVFGQYWRWDAPGAEDTYLWDVDDRFAVVGMAITPPTSPAIYRDPVDGTWMTLTPPYPWLHMDAVSINASGQIAGRIGQDDPARPGFLLWAGFIATPRAETFAPQGQAVAALSQSLRAAGRSADSIPGLRIAPTGCEEGHGQYVPLKLWAARGCR